jgi:hypothetical protein
MVDYHFGSGTFDSELWIDGKRVFKRPIGVDVEFTTAGAFEWIFADATGAILKKIRHENAHGGWTSINFASLGLYDDYSIGFENASGSKLTVKQGDVHLP